MSKMSCDECGIAPYLDVPERNDVLVELVCDCSDLDPVAVVLEDHGGFFRNGVQDRWGETRDGNRFVCYQCGDSPHFRTSVSGGMPPRINYGVMCSCDKNGSGLSYRNVLPDRWKDDMDETKWDVTTDDVRTYIYTNGEALSKEDIASIFDVSPAAAKCLFLRLQQKGEVVRVEEDGTTKITDVLPRQ